MDIEKLKKRCGYDGKPQQFKYGFDLACRELAKAQAVPESFVLVNKKDLVKVLNCVTDDWLVDTDSFEEFKKIESLVQGEVNAMIEAAQEPTPLKVGDLVEPKDYRYILASGACRYPYAYVVNTSPFQLMSEEGDMYWCCTVEVDGYKLLKSNVQLPKGVVDRMIREGLIAPVEAQEQAND